MNFIDMETLPALMKNIQSVWNKWWVLLFATITILVSSCSNPDRQNKKGAAKDVYKDTIFHKPPATFPDTIIIDFPAAVFYNPDSLQLEKIKAITDPMIFESTVHDCFYQMKNARMSLKDSWPQIRIIETSKARYLLFIKSDKSKIYVDLNSKNDMCGLFLFNRQKSPILVDMTNIGTELDFYFLKKVSYNGFVKEE